MTHEREITGPVDLCLPNGRLNPAAVGWSRRPLHRANLRGWGRTKRWEYWGIVTPTHIVGLVASSLDYAGVHSVYVLDRRTGTEHGTEAVVPFTRAEFPSVSGVGPVRVQARGLSIDIAQRPEGSTVRATAPGVEVDLELPLRPGHESLGVVVPWSTRRFQYTVKDVGRPARGLLRVAGTEYPVVEQDSFAVLDHGRGRWPYAIRWNWAAGSGSGRAIQLGGRWTDGTGSTENAVFVDGRLHKIGADLAWSYDRTDWLRPWRITGDRVDVTFHPFHERVARTNLVVLANETHQCFGHFSGWAATDDGERVDLDGLVGWAEEARNRW
ncbi:DUF2804 domain-containing protein [Micromonospora echinofusca]|uniref:DUF2804 family protein n=1 Tax=Micromonospora echinofusca TaxID=47858 RepID=A0ABS3VSN7_MICEH|nr:DUF2804 domain-containing protein [Micromonospora echinofusca]MBO4207510.1 DUF2804 family protein [Micromonospora echinofusca]